MEADLYHQALDERRLSSRDGYPTPFCTIFGWVLIGKTKCLAVVAQSSVNSYLCALESCPMEAQFKQFCDLEELL